MFTYDEDLSSERDHRSITVMRKPKRIDITVELPPFVNYLSLFYSRNQLIYSLLALQKVTQMKVSSIGRNTLRNNILQSIVMEKEKKTIINGILYKT